MKGNAQPPIFCHICCGQMARWNKMALGMEVGLGPSHILLYIGTQLPLPKQGDRGPNFGPFLLWPDGCMHQDATCYGVGLGPGHIVLDGDPTRPKRWWSSEGGAEPSIFGRCLLWPNGSMDLDVTWYRGRPRPKRHCVRWGPSSPAKRAHPPIFGPYLYCGQTVVCIRMSLCTEVGLSLGDIVLDGDPGLPPIKGIWRTPPIFSVHVRCGHTAGWTKMPLAMEVVLSSGDFVLDGDTAPSPEKRAQNHPIFGP